MSRHSATKLPVTMQNGFTLVELIIVLAIAGILLLIATPNYDSVIIGSKVDKARYSLASSLAFARTEAVKRGEEISLCLGSSGACGTNQSVGDVDWSTAGWHVRTSAEILRTVDSDNDGVAITYDCGNFISFNSEGEKSTTGTNVCEFEFADSGGNSTFDKSLFINAMGRVRMN
ncbi:MAG: GspH/FimT family pseudopilin [Motiliproteus sp.]|nr:GspH/FimT family pseudopilin [Motiliproteus sp.]MCW9052317.1 GspH/FimT family pseudopilin [Motiliproteus sp.]